MKPSFHKSIIILFLMLVSGSNYGQVKNKSFNFLLITILTNRVKRVSVEEVTKSTVK